MYSPFLPSSLRVGMKFHLIIAVETLYVCLSCLSLLDVAQLSAWKIPQFPFVLKMKISTFSNAISRKPHFGS